jgi:hypothetical protein
MSFEHHPNAKKVYDYYQRRYCLGSLGIWHALGLASISLKNEPVVLSSLIIANGGSFKSQVMKSFKGQYSNKYWEVPFQPTDRGIMRENLKGSKKHTNNIWLIDDAAVSFPSLEAVRQSRLVGLFTVALMDGKYSYSDFNETKELTARFGLYMNIAYQNFFPIKAMLAEKTFLERIVPFNFILPRADVDNVTKEYMGGHDYGKPPKLTFREAEVDLSVNTIWNEIKYISQVLEKYCELSQTRATMWTKIILKSVAAMEGRNKVNRYDFDFVNEHILSYLSMNIRLDPIERVMIKMLRINSDAILDDFKDFLTSEFCLKEFPNEHITYNYIEVPQRNKFFENAKRFIEDEKKILERSEVSINGK